MKIIGKKAAVSTFSLLAALLTFVCCFSLTQVKAEEAKKLTFQKDQLVYTQLFLTDAQIAAGEIEATGYSKQAKGKVEIPSKVTYNGKTYKVTSVSLFKDCKKITSIVIPDTVTNLSACSFEGCSKLKTVTLSKNIKKLPTRAFAGCGKLTKVNNMEQLTEIGSSAFEGCKSLSAITIGKNVKKLGFTAFLNCKNLKKITVKTTKLKEKNVGFSVFSGISKKAVFDLPAKKKKAYTKYFS